MQNRVFIAAVFVATTLTGLTGAHLMRPAVPDAAADAKDLPNAESIAVRVQAFYDQTRTFQAGFKQEYFIKLHGEKRTSEGRVAFEKPGRMSWKYDEPNGNRVVSDGNVLRVYERENAQMFEQPVNKSQYPAALSFLMGQGELLSRSACACSIPPS